MQDPDLGGDCFVQVRKGDLERLSTEVMQLREFLPKVFSGDFIDSLHKARSLDTQLQHADETLAVKEQSQQEQQQLKQECQHLRSRLEALQAECQREREEKMVLREQLWESREQLQQQAEFCTGLGAASCTLLWSASRKEEAVRDILADFSSGAVSYSREALLEFGKVHHELTFSLSDFDFLLRSDTADTSQQGPAAPASGRRRSGRTERPRRKWGKRGRLHARLKDRAMRPPLPSLLLANVRSRR
ncbi:hypothetical protein NFI96_007675 [Prochilodus magdalenae]|nr:hypothetical protein NFI96_007675 [Prochilodus magdalenae]